MRRIHSRALYPFTLRYAYGMHSHAPPLTSVKPSLHLFLQAASSQECKNSADVRIKIEEGMGF